jgi:glycosyltransferase involved in cell wall biosynthesis
MSAMQILFATGREPEYPRNDVLRRALGRVGHVTVTSDSRPGSLLARTLRVFLRTAPRLLTKPFDLVYVGFYGHLLMLLLRPLTRRPIVFDAFISTYDTLCFDRQTFTPTSPAGQLAFRLDQIACRCAQHVLLDTNQNKSYFSSTFGVPSAKISVLPVGCNEDLFSPRPPCEADTLNVLYYMTYLPLHGAETVVRAAALLRSERGVRFRLLGAGPDQARVADLAATLGLDNLTFAPPVPLSQLPGEIAASHICLGGHFGLSAKAGRVIPGKIYQMLAMARPVIAADTSANRELLTHLDTAYLCSPGDPVALAGAVAELYQKAELRRRLAQAGRELYVARCSEAAIGAQVRQLVTGLAH